MFEFFSDSNEAVGVVLGSGYIGNVHLFLVFTRPVQALAEFCLLGQGQCSLAAQIAYLVHTYAPKA
jgi:hypothetical protein